MSMLQSIGAKKLYKPYYSIYIVFINCIKAINKLANIT